MEKFSEEELKVISENLGKLIKNGQLIILISNATDEGNTEIIPIIKDNSPGVSGSGVQIDLSDQLMGTSI
tara:strand:- start:217 stop:426 length:210 start_codon:yes stop_codon:yes gene_type:complete